MECLTYQFDEHRLNTEGNYICQVVSNRKLSNIYHRHDFYEIICVMNGSVRKRINEAERTISQSTVAILRPTDRHCFLSQSKGTTILSLSVKTEEFVRIAEAFCQTMIQEINERAEVILIRAERLVQWIQSEGLKNRRADYREQDNRFLLMCLLKAYLESTDERSRMPQLLEYAAREMRRTENLKRGIPAFLELSHYSQSQLSRLIRQHFQMSLKQYVNELRLRCAYDEIVLTNRSVQDISESVGFASFSHFNKIFKKKFFSTPAALRKKNGIWTA